MTHPATAYRTAEDLDIRLGHALAETLTSEDDLSPILTGQRLDIDAEQRLGYLTDSVLSELMRSPGAPVLSCGTVTVDDITVCDYHNNECLPDGLEVVPYLCIEQPDGHLLRTKGPQLLIARISRASHLGDEIELAGQVRAFTEVVLTEVTRSLNRQLDFYRAAQPEPVADEPATTTLPVTHLDDSCVLIGDADGHSAVEENLGTDDRGLIRIRTEHGLLLLDPAAEVIVSGEPGIPEVLTCAHQTYRATLETPAEFCEEDALPDNQYCARHTREEDR